MLPILQEIDWVASPEVYARNFRGEPGLILLRSGLFDDSGARYSFLAADPFLQFKSWGARCEIRSGSAATLFGNPWIVLSELISRYELLEQIDSPFPLGGCFGYWGYDLKNFVEPSLGHRAVHSLETPDCSVGFYDSLMVFDHFLGKAWIISTGLKPDGSREEQRARQRLGCWLDRLPSPSEADSFSGSGNIHAPQLEVMNDVCSTFTKARFIEAVHRAQRYIQAGDIYQVNLAQRLTAPLPSSPWELYLSLLDLSPAPFAAYADYEDFQIISTSPELFLRLSGSHVITRPIKGTRPRSNDPIQDALLTEELLASPKERAELIMITDLLRNDLGRVCEFGSIHVPQLLRLQQLPQVSHLFSTIEGRLRGGLTHLEALAACFPGGSITGAPKIRAMQIIDELEPVARGPYTGALGYIGFNGESQLSIIIRSAICQQGLAHYYAGAGIVADSSAEAEYAETIAKSAAFLHLMAQARRHYPCSSLSLPG